MLHRPSLSLSLLVAVTACASSPPPVAAVGDRPTAMLPSVDLVTLDGKPARLEATLAGRPALVSLWATWCEACGDELNALNRLDARLATAAQDAHGTRGLVVAVAVGERHEAVADFTRRHSLRYAQLVDEQFHLADALGQRRVPATLVVDRKGQVVYAGGSLDGKALRALSAALAD